MYISEDNITEKLEWAEIYRRVVNDYEERLEGQRNLEIILRDTLGKKNIEIEDLKEECSRQQD